MPIDLARFPRALPSIPPDDPELRDALHRVLDRVDVRRVIAQVRAEDAHTVEQQLLLASTPAPPFQEEERGRLFARLLLEAGTDAPRVDEVGNVIAWLGGEGARPLVVSAHLDTVFPVSQEIQFHKDGDRWIGPGICDDARGLTAVLALTRALVRLDYPPDIPLLLVGTVGEEGVGNLRGVRHLFGAGGAGENARGFISLDGAGVNRIIASGVGSRRFRAVVEGPGGHSWVDWGRVNPIHLLARAVAAFDDLDLPAGTTLNVGRIEGGTSVNAIPARAWMEYEVRSESEGHLALVEGAMHGALTSVVQDGNGSARPDEEAVLEVDRIGDRPAGTTSPDEPLVRAATQATRALVDRAELAASSTDANLPMALGIPAITLGAGGEAGEAHTPREWYRNEKGPEGVLRALFTLLALEQIDP
jgi:acetylornithine deacetylase/succinyl-diaminopimelate desuccinylase-like protein